MFDDVDPNEPKPVGTGMPKDCEPGRRHYIEIFFSRFAYIMAFFLIAQRPDNEDHIIQLPFMTVFSSPPATEIEDEAEYAQLLENLTSTITITFPSKP